mgnify:CR=1 FL=1
MLLNPNVPSSAQTPGTFLFISTAPTSTGTAEQKNLFLVSTGLLQGSALCGQPYNLTAGTVDPNDIQQYSDVVRVHAAFHGVGVNQVGLGSRAGGAAPSSTPAPASAKTRGSLSGPRAGSGA